MTASPVDNRIRVVVTRPNPRGEGLAERLEQRGFRAVLMPLLEVTAPVDSNPLHRAAAEGSNYDGWIFTSAPAVEAFLGHAPSGPSRQATIVAVGKATAAALARHGHQAIIPDVHTAEGVLELVSKNFRNSARLLVPQAADAQPTLVAGLNALGFDIDCVATHDKVLPPAAISTFADLFGRQPYGWVTFTSSRIVEHFVALAGASWPSRRGELAAASIGPVTSQALRAQGVGPKAEAESPSDDCLVEAMVRVAALNI